MANENLDKQGRKDLFMNDKRMEELVAENDKKYEMNLKRSFPSNGALEDRIVFYAFSIKNLKPSSLQTIPSVYTLRELKEVYFPKMKPGNKSYIVRKIEDQLESLAKSPGELDYELKKAGMSDFAATKSQIMEYINSASIEPDNKVIVQTHHINPLSDEERVFKALKHLVDSGILKIDDPKSIKKISTTVLINAYNELYEASHPLSGKTVIMKSKALGFMWEKGNGNLSYLEPTTIADKDFKVWYEYQDNKLLKNISDMEYKVIFVTKERGVFVTFGKTTLVIRCDPDEEEQTNPEVSSE